MRIIKTVIALALISSFLSHAQNSYEEYVNSYIKGLRNFKNKRDSVFAGVLKERWEYFTEQQGRELEVKPIPVKPFSLDKNQKPQSVELETDIVIPVTKVPVPDKVVITPVTEKPQIEEIIKEPSKAVKPKKTPPSSLAVRKPVDNITVPVNDVHMNQGVLHDGSPEQYVPATVPPNVDPGNGNCKFGYLGSQISVNIDPALSFRLAGISENDIAGAWSELCGYDYKRTVDDCIKIKESLAMNDWMFFNMLRTIAETWFSGHNEAALFSMFLAVQSGYDVKVAGKGGSLILLFNSAYDIYRKSFINIGNARYYIIDETGKSGNSISTYRGKFDNITTPFDMRIRTNALLKKDIKETNHKSDSIDINTGVNKNLMDFYNSYPNCDYSVYIGAPVSDEFRATVLNPVKDKIRNKNEIESANIILNFVQNGFSYMTDQEQFGYERPFFAEECFYYPYSDCEDRSILFYTLIRELLGLDVVLLDYPNHIATAVRFDNNVEGDYVMIDNKKYIICDPTCINARVGVIMPDFRTVKAKVLKYS